MRRVRAHQLYYTNAGIKVVRTTSMLCLQLLVLTEAPPWCVSLSKDAGGGTCNVATLPEYEMSGFPILSPATTHMIEGVCLFVQALDLTVRRFVHGEALWSQAFEAWAVRCTTSILATLIDARACMLESVSRVGSIAAATDLGANVGVPSGWHDVSQLSPLGCLVRLAVCACHAADLHADHNLDSVCLVSTGGGQNADLYSACPSPEA